MRARLQNCAGCGRTLNGYTACRCVFGCGAYYCRRGRQHCADQHAKTCPKLKEHS